MSAKQARSFKWVFCKICGASIIAGKPCDVCSPRMTTKQTLLDKRISELEDVRRILADGVTDAREGVIGVNLLDGVIHSLRVYDKAIACASEVMERVATKLESETALVTGVDAGDLRKAVASL